jgi:hypothetical protein
MARDIVNKLPKGMDKKKADPRVFEIIPSGAMNSLGVFVG